MRAALPGKGVSAPYVGRGGSEADRDSGTPVGRMSNRQAREACERSVGESSGKASDGQPWKGETQGSTQRLAD